MKYVSIDIETTGLDPEQDQILQFAAIIDDTEHPEVELDDLPQFQRIILHDRVSGSPQALAMNTWLLEEIAAGLKPNGNRKETCRIKSLANQFFEFLKANGAGNILHSRIHFVAAGKNFGGFDRLFLDQVPNWNRYIQTHRRVLDPTSLFFNPTSDEVPPCLKQCLERSGYHAEVTHEATEDAKDVIRVLRYAFANQFVRGVE